MVSPSQIFFFRDFHVSLMKEDLLQKINSNISNTSFPLFTTDTYFLDSPCSLFGRKEHDRTFHLLYFLVILFSKFLAGISN